MSDLVFGGMALSLIFGPIGVTQIVDAAPGPLQIGKVLHRNDAGDDVGVKR